MCCNLKTKKLFDYGLIGVCVVIRSNKVGFLSYVPFVIFSDLTYVVQHSKKSVVVAGQYLVVAEDVLFVSFLPLSVNSDYRGSGYHNILKYWGKSGQARANNVD